MRPDRISCFALAIVMGISLACLPNAPAQADDLSVLSGWIQWSDSANSLQHRLNSDAFPLLEKRSAAVSGLRSAEAWKGRQAEVRRLLEKTLGPFPAKNPLNCHILVLKMVSRSQADPSPISGDDNMEILPAGSVVVKAFSACGLNPRKPGSFNNLRPNFRMLFNASSVSAETCAANVISLVFFKN